MVLLRVTLGVRPNMTCVVLQFWSAKFWARIGFFFVLHSGKPLPRSGCEVAEQNGSTFCSRGGGGGVTQRSHRPLGCKVRPHVPAQPQPQREGGGCVDVSDIV